MPYWSIGDGTGGYHHTDPHSWGHSDFRGDPEACLVSQYGTRPVQRVTPIATCNLYWHKADVLLTYQKTKNALKFLAK
jgi:hypothetical protein